MSDKILKKILVVISENFPNGIRADFIAENQVRQAYKLRYDGEEIPNIIDLISLIKRHAFFSEGKYYLVNARNRNHMMRLIDTVLNAGNVIVYYEEFFNQHREAVQELQIMNASVLAAVLKERDGRFFCSEKYISINKFVKLSDVIAYIVCSLSTSESFSVEQIKERLPYVPVSAITHALNNQRKYLKTTDGKYLSTEHVTIDRDEVMDVRNVLLIDLKTNGHAIFNLQDFSNTVELNPELSEQTVGNYIFEHFLSNDFSRHGNILTARGTAAGGIRLLKRFCASRDELTLNELFDRAKKLNVLQQTAIIDAANDSMFRVSKNLFVKEELLNFNVAAIDKALSPFVQGKIIALRDVTNFSTFLPVEDIRGFEWEWNLYMLESFLSKKSNRFQFHTSSPSNLAKGAICPREQNFRNYVDLMSAVIVQERIPLNSTSINDFLIAKNFRTRRVERVTSSIIERAHVLLRRSL